MTLSLLLGFFITSLILAIAPGPDNIFVLLQSAMYGSKSGLCVVLGLITGLVCQTIAAALGIAAVIAAMPVLFFGIRLAGALYLMYLAYNAWMHPVNRFSDNSVNSGYIKLWRRGLIMNVTNPKVQIFFLAFFPQFIPKGMSSTDTVFLMITLGFIFMVSTALVFGSVAVFSGALADRLRSDRFQLYLNRISALIFVSLAILTLVSG